MKGFLSILGLVGLLPGVYLTILTFRSAQTVWAWVWLAIYLLLCIGAFLLQNEPRRARWVGGVGLGLLAAVILLRGLRAGDTYFGRTTTLPAGGTGRWLGRLVEESDLALLGFTAMTDFGVVRKEEALTARPLLRAAYRGMRADPDFRTVPTPLAASILNLSGPGHVEATLINPPAPGEQAERAIVVLHGLGGAVNLPCYLLARQLSNAFVVCPSVGVAADWGLDRGAQVFQEVLTWLTPQTRSVCVVALSAATVGAQRLLARNLLGHVSGAVLISGFNEEEFDAIRRSDIPLLMIRGTTDTRTPRFDLQGQFAHLAHVHALELEGGHYVFLEQQGEVLDQIDQFCAPR
ncbi:MAG: alpha/beta hydrolase [Deltaproteobacteria bacterium]|nr:alpha/beta hydrolase [Deltaproteobacteria bacterium]